MFIKNLPTFVFCAISTLMLTSCSQNVSVKSNVNPENFREYFSASNVKIVNDESALETPYKLIGLVEGESCQVKAHHELPNEIDARTNARKKAHAINANAVIFTACTLIENNEANKQCIATRVCYAKAFITQP
ncbi:MAG: Rcs stress response system protein RcsF [Thalassotalea sp.]